MSTSFRVLIFILLSCFAFLSCKRDRGVYESRRGGVVNTGSEPQSGDALPDQGQGPEDPDAGDDSLSDDPLQDPEDQEPVDPPPADPSALGWDGEENRGDDKLNLIFID